MHHALIVARMAPDSAPAIADVFAASDRGELPHLIGVKRRSLFQFGDVYMHLIEADQDPAPAIAKVVGHPEFRSVSEQLSAYVSAYDPQTWRSPRTPWPSASTAGSGTPPPETSARTQPEAADPATDAEPAASGSPGSAGPCRASRGCCTRRRADTG